MSRRPGPPGSPTIPGSFPQPASVVATRHPRHWRSSTRKAGHGHVDESIKRSHDGLRAVLVALGALAVAAVVQTVMSALSGSVALLADLIHNFGDALTAVPLGIAFCRSDRAERGAGMSVVAALFIGAAWRGWRRSSVWSTRHRRRIWRRWRRPAPSALWATGSQRGSVCGPESGWTARRWSPPATTRARAPVSRWR